MFAVLTIALKNLQRRMLQGLLVGAVVALSVLLFFAGVGLIQELTGPFERMFDAQRGSHITASFDTRIYDAATVRTWWLEQEEVLSVTQPRPRLELEGAIYHEARELNSLVYVAERVGSKTDQDTLVFVEGGEGDAPGIGEVWVPTSIAAEAGLEAGDLLQIPTYSGLQDLRVGAVVVDPQSSAPFNNPKRIWLGPGQMARYFALSDLSGVEVGVRLRDALLTEELWERFLTSMGGDFSGGSSDYSGLILGYTAPYSAMAAMLVAFSILSVLIALFAMHGTLTSAMLADYRTIGLLRAQGFTPAQVRDVYRFQYMILAVAAIPIGVALGVLLVRRGVALLMSTTGTEAASSSLLGLAAATTVVFAALVWVFVGLVARRAGKIRPSEAIRSGASIVVKGARFPALDRMAWAGVPFVVAVRSLSIQKGRAALLVATVVFATLAASLAVNLDHSFRQGTDDPSLLGFDDADVRLQRAGRRFSMRYDTLMAVLRQHPDVAHIATSDFVEGELILGGGSPARALLGTVVSGDIEELKHRNISGRNPRTPHEVSLGVNTALEFGYEIGDNVPLFLSGQQLDLEVTGLFQTLNNGGTGFRILLEGLRTADPLYEPAQFGVQLRDGLDPGDFIRAIEGEYGEAIDGQPGDYFMRRIMDTVLTGMRISNGFLASVLLLAAAVFIFSSTLMSIVERRRMFGILKTVGMTPWQLRLSILIGVALLTTLGIGLGLGLWTVGAGAFLSLLFSGLGLVAFPLATSLVGTALAVVAIFGTCLASGWWSSARLRTVEPRSLVLE